MKLKFIFFLLFLFFAIPCFADATTATAKKVGPVSYYGALHTSGGKIIGANNNAQAMLRGVSLFWSDATGQPYYNSDVIAWAKDSLKIDVFRFAMGIQYYNSQGNATEPLDKAYSYMDSPDGFLILVDKMVQAAVENDVYIILDWHSHRAENEIQAASSFFSQVSQKYANIPNVIYEIYNEPVHTSWSTVQNYANTIVPLIRANTQNLILVGTPNWSQMGDYGGVSGTNIGYVFHFYAGTHKVSTFGSRLTSAINSGYPVFVSEWGTTSADGNGNPDASASAEWLSFMETHRLSNCNWSLRQSISPQNNESETSAIFTGSTPLTTKKALSEASYSTSGNIVKNYLKQYAGSWNDSLTKGHRTGSCAFNHQNVTIFDTQLSNVLKGACSYTSSNTDVATISGSTILIHGVGYAIIEGNDGSKSIITVADLPKQEITNFQDLTCRWASDSSGTCTKNRGQRYSGTTSNFEWVLGISTTTNEGATFSLTSLNPDIVTTKQVACKTIYCSTGQKEATSVHMYEFKKFGEAKIVATAPAITGYQALNDTITVTYGKKLNKIPSAFKDTSLALNSTVENIFQETAVFCNAPISYTFDGESTSPYLSKLGTSVITGAEDAIVKVLATSQETDYCASVSVTKTFVVGDSTQASNAIAVTKPAIPFHLSAQNNGILLQIATSSNVKWSLIKISGELVASGNQALSSGTHLLSFENIPSGSYFFKATIGKNQGVFRWIKR